MAHPWANSPSMAYPRNRGYNDSVVKHGYRNIHGHPSYPRTRVVCHISTAYSLHIGYTGIEDTHGYKPIHGQPSYPWITHLTIAHP